MFFKSKFKIVHAKETVGTKYASELTPPEREEAGGRGPEPVNVGIPMNKFRMSD
jgi:hypothetical protein